MENFLSIVMPLVAIIAITLIIVFIVRSKNDGTALVKEFKKKKVIFLEVLLAAMNVFEAFIAAEVSASHGLNYSVRIAMHLSLATMSIVTGMTYFSLWYNVAHNIKHKAKPVVIIKEVVEVLLASALVFIPPFVNTMFIVLGRNSQGDMQVFVDNLLHVHFFQAMFSVKDPVSFVSSMMFVIHIIGIVYLGLYGLDTAKKETIHYDDDDEDDDDESKKPSPDNKKPTSPPSLFTRK